MVHVRCKWQPVTASLRAQVYRLDRRVLKIIAAHGGPGEQTGRGSSTSCNVYSAVFICRSRTPRLTATDCCLQWKKFVYVEPPKRVKEVLEEELYFRRDGCQIKHPAAVALEGIWSVKRNFSVGGLKPASQNRNSLLSQPKYYSRHGGIRSKRQ
uniref:Chromosome 11 open reading frame 97 n=1 Tax=Terrapene triunguis TaxID=2587831 RepID=A0A674KB23_9SAUR